MIEAVFTIQGDEMKEMGLWCNMTLTTDIVRVMARVREVRLCKDVKTDWEMVRRTLGNCRKEGTMRLQQVQGGLNTFLKEAFGWTEGIPTGMTISPTMRMYSINCIVLLTVLDDNVSCTK